jgi:hypothetical protein
MSSGIFLLGDDGALSEMLDQPYESESVLHELLARRIHPTPPVA